MQTIHSNSWCQMPLPAHLHQRFDRSEQDCSVAAPVHATSPSNSPPIKREASDQSDGGSVGTHIYRTRDTGPGEETGVAAVTGAGSATWLRRLCSCTFFGTCEEHLTQRRNECTFFCLDCNDTEGLCNFCLPAHRNCRLLQLRRYVYRDVVKLGDIQKFMDASGVQTYVVNHAKAIFISAKDRQPTGCYFRTDSTSTCRACGRGLREGSLYCSLNCKVANYSNQLEQLLIPMSSGGSSVENNAMPALNVPRSPAWGHMSSDSAKRSMDENELKSTISAPRKQAVRLMVTAPSSSAEGCKRISRRKQPRPSRAVD